MTIPIALNRLSLDEAFLDVSQCPRCHGSATLIAQEIRQRVADTIGITVSAGIAPNKFIAKIASDLNKPNGQYVVTPQQVDGFLQKMPVNRIWGVGKVTAQRLEQQGIKTCADVRAYDIFQFVTMFGQFGDHIHKLAHGIDDRPVVSEWRRKSVSVENTYDQDLPDLASCLLRLPDLLESLKNPPATARHRLPHSQLLSENEILRFQPDHHRAAADQPQP